MPQQDRSTFVRSWLPWIVAAVMLAVYLVTLNRWISLTSLPVVAGVTTPDAPTPLVNPLQYLLSLPFRWLPAGTQAIALNAFSALCAALTLALLARSVALLPQDRTRDQRHKERSAFSLLSLPAAWLPVVAAVLACGLQITFWEHATAATGEMLNLLLFAYCIRCLLEYRVSQEDSWLYRMALVYGLATTNNYAMIGFFPLFVGAIVWIRGRSFFQFQFFLRMLACGSAGLLLYLLLPALNAMSEASDVSFLEALRIQLGSQRSALQYFPRYLLLIAGITSLVPIFFIGIRWPSTFGDTSAIGPVITGVAFRIVHAGFLVACLWTMFNAPFSPRRLMENLLAGVDDTSGGVPLLTLYYLTALCIGYLLGYFLVVYSPDPGRARHRTPALERLAAPLVTAAVWLLSIGVPAALAYLNLPSIRANDGSGLRSFARHSLSSLPGQPAIVLSDFPALLAVAEAEHRSETGRPGHLFVDTRLLGSPDYQAALHRRAPQLWPTPPETPSRSTAISPAYLLRQLGAVALTNAVFYLHPSFGYFFEPLYQRPHGIALRLQSYATNELTPPHPTPALISENQSFWDKVSPSFRRLLHASGRQTLDGRVLAQWYSRSLNFWGVQLQRSGHVREAGPWFELATRLNPANFAAATNLRFNQQLASGKIAAQETGRSAEEKFGDRYRTWSAMLAANGPLDEPGFCLRLGQTLGQESLFRQSAIEFLRVIELEPNNIQARLLLASVYLLAQAPDLTLATTRRVRDQFPTTTLGSTNQLELARLEAFAHLAQGRPAEGERLLLAARQAHPQNAVLLDVVSQFYLAANQLTNALASIELQLKLNPDHLAALLNKAAVCAKLKLYPQANAALDELLRRDPKSIPALLNKGAILIQSQAYADALAPLNQALKLEPDNTAARLNRAIALLQNNQLAAARDDYEILLQALPTVHSIHYGLGEIAYRSKDFPAAIRHYENYLRYAPGDTEEYRKVTARLAELKAGQR